MVVSKAGIEVIDAHAHFMTYATVQQIIHRQSSQSDESALAKVQQRVSSLTDMHTFTMPAEDFDTGKAWVDELDRYGISAIGMMISKEAWDEINETRKRFPGRFLGYANINPADDDAVDLVKRAGKDGFQGIKLYPTSWSFHASDDIVRPVYEEALKQKLLVIAHFGITIGTAADLRYGNPLDLQKPAHDFQDLNFMIAHFGAGFFREVLMLMYQTDNISMDTSGSNAWMKYQPYDLSIKKIFEKALKAGGPERIVFGTDSSFFPRGFRYNILEEEVDAVRAICPQLCLSDDAIDRIFRKNIIDLTGFKPG